VIQYFFVVALPVLALYDADPLVHLAPVLPALKIASDQLRLSAQGLLHLGDYALVGFVLHEGQRVYLVAGQRWKFMDLLEDILRQVLAARVDDVLLVAEDVAVGCAGDVVPQLSLGASIHRIYYGVIRKVRKHQKCTSRFWPRMMSKVMYFRLLRLGSAGSVLMRGLPEVGSVCLILMGRSLGFSGWGSVGCLCA
jgi:hypothetical protein